MKILVTYYSRTGNTKYVGERIAKKIGADTDKINDNKSRTGIIGWLSGCIDTFFKKPTTITIKKDPEKYDLVIIGTPIWLGTMVPAIKKYLESYTFKKVAFFCTAGDKQKKAFEEMKTKSKKPLATLDVKDDNIKKSEKEIKMFCEKINKIAKKNNNHLKTKEHFFILCNMISFLL